MDMIRTRALRGPNLWSRHTALEMEVRCAPDERAVDSRPGFEDRLRALCPGLGTLRTPTRRGAITLAHALESTLLALQAASGCPVTFSHTEDTHEDGVYLVVVEYTEEEVARRALDTVLSILQAAWSPEAAAAAAPDGQAASAELRELDEDLRLGPSTGAIVAAAVARGIPFRRLTTPARWPRPLRKTKTSPSTCCNRPPCRCPSVRRPHRPKRPGPSPSALACPW